MTDLQPDHIGIFGGTFDPVHRGHIATVQQLVAPCKLDQVRYIPVSIPPHREQPVASSAHRLQMVKIALEDAPGFIADNRELERDGLSYMYDTVVSLEQDFPGSHFSLILGVDALLGFDQWHRWQELLSRIGIIAMTRPDWTMPDQLPDWLQQALINEQNQPSPLMAGKIQLAPIDPIAVSATEVRRLLGSGQTADHLLHHGVAQFIRNQHLYE